MAALIPFRALRPRSSDAAHVAAVPYDVVSAGEAKALADGNPLSFLRVSRAEIELPPGTNPYGDEVYARAKENFTRLKDGAMLLENEPSLYFYRLRMGPHEQVGIAACFSLDEYDRDVIKKHERTRADKEDDRTRHMIALGAQTGPVFLTYRASSAVDSTARQVMDGEPLYDFDAHDGVRHTLWKVPAGETAGLVESFHRIPALYIADGHHRAASAARARAHVQPHDALGAGAGTVLAVAFPHDQVQILPYNRVVKDLGKLSPAAFVEALREHFAIDPGPPSPARQGARSPCISRANGGLCGRARGRTRATRSDRSTSACYRIACCRRFSASSTSARTSASISSAAREAPPSSSASSTPARRRLPSRFPGERRRWMAVSDAGAIMPPKSTWFEPKLRDGFC
jgi:uncharacterized protein (DUF1015 family)